MRGRRWKRNGKFKARAPVISAVLPAAFPPSGPELRRKFGHADTLGTDSETRMAMDRALEDSGGFDLISRAHELNSEFGNAGFMGYAALAQLTQNGLVRACVTGPAADMTRNWINITRTAEESDGSGALRLSRINEAFEQFNVKKILTRAAELTGFFGGCFIFIDTGARRPEDLANPLIMTSQGAELVPGALRGFRIIEPVNVSPGDYDATDPVHPDFYRPRNWFVSGRKIHSTRMIKVSGPSPPQLLLPMYNFLGIPQAQLIHDYIVRFQSMRHSAADLLKNMSSKVLKSAMGSDIDLAANDRLVARLKYLALHQDNNGVLLLDKDSEDFIKVEHSLAGVADMVQQALELICAVNGTPVVKTLGLSPKGFNATGEVDLKNYYDRVRGLQSGQLQPALEIILRAVQLHLFGAVDDTVTFTFMPLSEDDRQLKANIQKTLAETAGIYLDRGVISAEEVRDNLADDPESGFDDIRADDVPELEEPEMELSAPPPLTLVPPTPPGPAR